MLTANPVYLVTNNTIHYFVHAQIERAFVGLSPITVNFVCYSACTPINKVNLYACIKCPSSIYKCMTEGN